MDMGKKYIGSLEDFSKAIESSEVFNNEYNSSELKLMKYFEHIQDVIDKNNKYMEYLSLHLKKCQFDENSESLIIDLLKNLANVTENQINITEEIGEVANKLIGKEEQREIKINKLLK